MRHWRILAVAIALLIVSAVLVIADPSVVVSAIGWALFGVAGVILVSLLFLLVGESEDRDRQRNPGG